jgi:hypothetical protein
VRLLAGIVALALLFGQLAHAQSANTENLVSGSGSATDTAGHTIIAAPTTTRRLYIRSLQCYRTDAGTTAIRVTLNDDASTVIGLPNNGGGGGSNVVFESPLTLPAATALTFTASAGTTTVYCNAQGFSGN